MPRSPAPIQDVSETALMVAMWRAMENEHPRPLFRDPYALKLAGERGKEILAQFPERRAAMSRWMMAVRTAIIDEMIRNAVAQGVDTVLNLGAGLDTRPYRMDLPKELRWVEVDCPKIIELKDAQLAEDPPVCQLKRLSCDLADPAARKALLSSVGAQAKRALVLTEGVIPYLTNDDVGALADDLKEQTAFRYWVADYFSPFVLRYRRREAKKRRLENAPFQFNPTDYFGFFALHGWRSIDVRSISAEAERLGRPIPRLMRAMYRLRGAFMSKQARDQMRNFMAYVLFEPAGSSGT